MFPAGALQLKPLNAFNMESSSGKYLANIQLYVFQSISFNKVKMFNAGVAKLRAVG